MMDDDFWESPLSPLPVYTQIISDTSAPRCFSCVCEAGQALLCPNGYINTGALKRLLLRLDPEPGGYEADTVDIFGFCWVTKTALLDSSSLLFSLFRKNFFKLESLAQSSSQDFGQASSQHSQAAHLREECITFLHYVKVFISRYLVPVWSLEEGVPSPEAHLPSLLLEQLFELTSLCGRLQDLPSSLQACLSMQHRGQLMPPTWHLLHLYLDIQWSVLEILHLLEEKLMGNVVYAHHFVNLTGKNLTNISLFEEHLSNLLMDLTSLAMTQYSKVRPTEALSSPPYQCTCTKELWLLLIHLLEHRSHVFQTKAFWQYINPILRILLKSTPAIISQSMKLSTHCKDVLGFTWWLVTHLAELGQLSSSGTHQDKKLTDNWCFIGELLKLTCGFQAGIQEEQIRMHLHCCLSLSLLWGSSMSVVTTLWEHFSKNLNSSFTVPWLGVSGFGSICSSPRSLLEQTCTCCNLELLSPTLLCSVNYTQIYRNASSFQIFLRVLAVHLSQQREEATPWRQIKGRVYSKFHQRRMLELSETGLMNYFLLFLVLARLTEPEDVCGRACELLALRPVNTQTMAQRMLQWRGQLAFVLIFQERQLDVSALTQGLVKSFMDAAREFYLKTTEPSRKLALWPLLGTYIDGVQEVFESSADLHLSEEVLVNQGFTLLLPACRQTELSSCLGFLKTILARLRRVNKSSSLSNSSSPLLPITNKEHHLRVAEALWTNFFPFLRNIRLTQTPPSNLEDCAAGFSLLALELPSSAPQDLQPNPFISIMQCFGWDEMLHPLVATQYLIQLLQNRSSIAALNNGSSQSLCVKAWVRCVLQQHLHRNPDGTISQAEKTLSQQLTELTRLIFSLPEIHSLLQRAGLVIADSMESGPALSAFIKAVGQAYSGLHCLAERSSMVSKALEYIGDVLRCIKPYLVNKSPAEGLQLAYRTMGCLVKRWSSLLATSKAQHLLFRIIDVLLLPHALLQPEKAIPPLLLAAVKDNLPAYLQGISVAVEVSQTQGEYLKQQLSSIITHYLGRFLTALPSMGALTTHPVLLAACQTPSNPKGTILRKTILLVLRDNFLQLRGQSPSPQLLPALAFLLELIRRAPMSEPVLLALPLPALLRCLLLVSDIQVKKLATDTLQLVIEKSAMSITEGPCEPILNTLRCFVEENMGLYDLQVYSILETVSILDSSLVEGLIPLLSQSLRNIEHKRGIGRNTTQRNAYKKLLSNLGEMGCAEMIALEED